METLKKKTLFWDCDPSRLDPENNKRFIIERILKYGDEEDVAWVQNRYSLDDIKDALRRQRTLDPKSLNWWRLTFDVAETECLPPSSTHAQSAFWNR